MPAHSKLTPEVADVLIGMVGKGHYLATAAKAAGVSRRTVTRWLCQASEEWAPGRETALTEFADRYRRAECGYEDRLLTKVVAGEKGWRSAAWLLVRRFPHQYGPLARHRQRAGKDPADMTDEELDEALGRR